MKTLVQASNEGLESLIGQKITLFCANYFYSGLLVGVGKNDVKLEDPSIVYETGAFTDNKYKDEQKLGVQFWYVKRAAIESYGVLH